MSAAASIDLFSAVVDDSSRPATTTRPFDDDGYLGYDPRLPSQRFNAFSSFVDPAADAPAIFDPPPYDSGDDAFPPAFTIPETPSSSHIYASFGDYSPDPQGLSSFLPEFNGFDEAFVSDSDGPILPLPSEMGVEEGFILREWRRQNAIELEEKERREKELVNQIRDEANEYKINFHQRRKLNCETNKSINREKEKLFLGNQEKSNAEADNNYWRAITELIPHELPTIEKKIGKNEEKKPAIVVIQGPKPGKPTDMSRMRQILLKIKHSPPSVPANAAALPQGASMAAPAEVVAVA